MRHGAFVDFIAFFGWRHDALCLALKMMEPVVLNPASCAAN
jgi:hypothetical protein